MATRSERASSRATKTGAPEVDLKQSATSFASNTEADAGAPPADAPVEPPRSTVSAGDQILSALDAAVQRLETALRQVGERWSGRSGAGVRGSGLGSWTPPATVLEDEDGVEILAEVPGVRRGDVRVTVLADAVEIAGVRAAAANEGRAHPGETPRTSEPFWRAFSLSPFAAKDRIEARLDAGLLTIRVPWRASPRRHQVMIS